MGESPPRARGAGSGRLGDGGGKGPPFPAGSSGSPPSCVLALCCHPGKSKSKEQMDVGASRNVREPTPDGQSLTDEAPSCLNKKYPGSASGKEPACQSTKLRRRGFDPWVRKIPWMRTRQATPVFLPGESPWTEEPGGLQSVGSQRGGDGGSGPKVGLVTHRSPSRRNPLRLRVPSGVGLRLVALVLSFVVVVENEGLAVPLNSPQLSVHLASLQGWLSSPTSRPVPELSSTGEAWKFPLLPSL